MADENFNCAAYADERKLSSHAMNKNSSDAMGIVTGLLNILVVFTKTGICEDCLLEVCKTADCVEDFKNELLTGCSFLSDCDLDLYDFISTTMSKNLGVAVNRDSASKS